jgi:hypothetical protein
VAAEDPRGGFRWWKSRWGEWGGGIEVATLDHHVTQVDPDAKLDALILRHERVCLEHPLLNRTAHRIYDARKLD